MLLAASLGGTAIAAAPGVGMATLEATDPVGGQSMSILLFYPSPHAAPATPMGPHAVQAAFGLPVETGTWPLVVLSHGQGGERLGHHDLASFLARNGFIVASFDHPRDNFRDPGGAGQPEVLYGRPRQVSAVISAVLAAPQWQPRIDPGRIGVAGFSMGGYTSLLLVGAVPRFERFTGYCRRHPQDRDTCDFIDSLGAGKPGGAAAYLAGLESLRTRWGQTRDARVKAAFVMAPTSVVFDAAGVAGIDRPVFLYYGEADSQLPPQENAAHLAGLLGTPQQTRAIAAADHWVFLAPCGPALAAEAPRICQDPPGVDRAALHQRINADALAFFQQALSGTDGDGAGR